MASIPTSSSEHITVHSLSELYFSLNYLIFLLCLLGKEDYFKPKINHKNETTSVFSMILHGSIICHEKDQVKQ